MPGSPKDKAAAKAAKDLVAKKGLDVPEMTEETISELREAFALFDKDGDGHVTITELRVVFQSRECPCLRTPRARDACDGSSVCVCLLVAPTLTQFPSRCFFFLCRACCSWTEANRQRAYGDDFGGG